MYNLLLSGLLGVIIGLIVRWALNQSMRRKWVDDQSMLVFSVACSLTIVGGVTLIDANQLLTCFIAGVVLAWDEGVQGVLNTDFSEVRVYSPSSETMMKVETC